MMNRTKYHELYDGVYYKNLKTTSIDDRSRCRADIVRMRYRNLEEGILVSRSLGYLMIGKSSVILRRDRLTIT